jgi:hypothetical protein
MRSKLTVLNPESIELELTVSMTLREWKQLRAQLGQGYPAWQFGIVIGNLVDHADKHFVPPRPPEE